MCLFSYEGEILFLVNNSHCKGKDELEAKGRVILLIIKEGNTFNHREAIRSFIFGLQPFLFFSYNDFLNIGILI